jgi:hypothetical protein
MRFEAPGPAVLPVRGSGTGVHGAHMRMLVVAFGFCGAMADLAPGALAQTLLVESSVCRALAVHRPAPDVAYRPGLDVQGRPVAPADLHSSAPWLAPNFTFDLNADLRGYLPPSSALSHPQLQVGRITLRPDGAVLLNGQELATAETARVALLCRRVPR